VSSSLAADWFLQYLSESRPAPASTPPPAADPRPSPPIAQSAALPPGVSTRDIRFYSEGVKCFGRLFLPADPAAPLPAVVLAPDSGQTHASMQAYAAGLASNGIAALAIDYRGWGNSGAYLIPAERVPHDDRLRFLQVTTLVEFRRGRRIPQHQIDDIRNAIAFLQGEPGIDPANISVWGHRLAAAHALSIAAMDSRVKTVIGTAPVVPGDPNQAVAALPPPSIAKAATVLARLGLSASPNEAQVAAHDYAPFAAIRQIPAAARVHLLFDQQTRAAAQTAASALAGSARVAQLPGSPQATARAVAEWIRAAQ
jgi:dienelactone hydrolase